MKDDDPIEFTCRDCGRHVIAFGFHIPTTLCNSCFWIRENITPEDQTAVRERLGVPLIQRH